MIVGNSNGPEELTFRQIIYTSNIPEYEWKEYLQSEIEEALKRSDKVILDIKSDKERKRIFTYNFGSKRNSRSERTGHEKVEYV